MIFSNPPILDKALILDKTLILDETLILDDILIVRNNLGKIISIKKENNQYANVEINNIVEKIDENYFDKTFQIKIDELDIDEYQIQPIEFSYNGVDSLMDQTQPPTQTSGVGSVDGTTITSAGGSTGMLNPTSAGDSSGMINP